MTGTAALIVDRKGRLWLMPFENDFIPFRLGRVNGRLHAFSTGTPYEYRRGSQKMSVIPYVIEDVESVGAVRPLGFWLLDRIRLTGREREFMGKLMVIKERIDGASLHDFLARKEPENIGNLFRQYDIPLVRPTEDVWRISRAIDSPDPGRPWPSRRSLRTVLQMPSFFYRAGSWLKILFYLIRSTVGMVTVGALSALILSHLSFF